MHPQILPWSEPLDLAASIDEAYWVLLYSSVRTSYSGRYSYLAHHVREHVVAENFSHLEEKLRADRAAFDNAWFGYLAYELKNSLESLPPVPANWLDMPALHMMRFGVIYQFDHEMRVVTRWAEDDGIPPIKAIPYCGIYYTSVGNISSNMTNKAYLTKAAHIIERIHAGDLYQANLTRKFFGQLDERPDYLGLFKALCTTSPAPYSAFLRLDKRYILSSSPEQFLQADSQGNIRTRPIKGTAARYSDPVQDQKSRDSLAASSKDRAENLMIADLMRNDLSRTCIPGSIAIESLFEVTTHATIHHMSSTVTGIKQPGASTLETVKQCFPPGSMTGAPKIKAMVLCDEMEQLQRGVYSGAIGWFGGDGSCELSVVIRTLLLEGNRFEFQVGGGIIADSTPEQELQELIDKSKGILAALGLSAGNISF